MRPYRMVRRGELVEQTRRRITEAAVRLHTTIGPAAASISAVAAAAGVTRVTVYRHFPTLDELYVACRAHWAMENQPPDTVAWTGIEVFDERLRTALEELFAWYAVHADELFPIYRDGAAMPKAAREASRAEERAMVEALLRGSDVTGQAVRRLRAAVGHATSFWTWRSLVVDQGLSQRDAVALAEQFVRASGPGRSAELRNS